MGRKTRSPRPPRRLARPLCLAFAILAVATPIPASGQVVIQKEKVTASGGAPRDRFGYAVSVDGTTAAIGAPGVGSITGSVYLYRYDNAAWIVQELTSSDARVGDHFGESIALGGDLLVVGAELQDENGSNSGAVYVYRCVNCTWIEEQKLTASDGLAHDHFGSSVSVDANVIVVGAIGDDNGIPASGSAYVFRFDGQSWIEEQRLLAIDRALGDTFGKSVSVSGDVIVVGAHLADNGALDSGAAYVFRNDGSAWVHEQKLPAPARAYIQFGTSVSVSGDVILGGAPGYDGPGNSGRAFLFRHDGIRWVCEQRLSEATPRTARRFGNSVSLDGKVAVVGVFDDRANMFHKATVFVHDGTWWQARTPLRADNREGYFASSVSVGGGSAIVGAYGDDIGGNTDVGSAYLYWIEPDPNPCTGGTVNARNNRVSDLLRVNGSQEHCVGAGIGSPIQISMDASPVGPHPGRFVLYAWPGEPDPTTFSEQPYNLGMTCFPTFLSSGLPKPAWVWNNLGHPSYLGVPDVPSYAAPTIVAASSTGFPHPITITLQGFVQDFGSPAGVPISVTNAVTLHVQ